MVLLFIIVIIGVALLLSSTSIKHGAGRKSKPTYQTSQPSAYDIWWKNLKRTPLSAAESQCIAERVAQEYDAWSRNSLADHSWLCIAINADKVEVRKLYKDFGSSAPAFAFTHSLSCQADREELAGYILRAVRQVDPYTSLHLDGDSLILSTN